MCVKYVHIRLVEAKAEKSPSMDPRSINRKNQLATPLADQLPGRARGTEPPNVCSRVRNGSKRVTRADERSVGARTTTKRGRRRRG